MFLPRRVLLGGLDVDLLVDLVPVVYVGHHHPGEQGRLLQLQPAAGGRHHQVVLAVRWGNTVFIEEETRIELREQHSRLETL